MADIIIDPETGERRIAPEKPPETPQIDPTDLNAVRAATWAWLVKTLSVMPPGAAGLPIAREIMDRLEGKPRQQIDQTLTGNITNTIQIVRFSDGKVIDQLDTTNGNDVTKLLPHDDKSIA